MRSKPNSNDYRDLESVPYIAAFRQLAAWATLQEAALGQATVRRQIRAFEKKRYFKQIVGPPTIRILLLKTARYTAEHGLKMQSSSDAYVSDEDLAKAPQIANLLTISAAYIGTILHHNPLTREVFEKNARTIMESIVPAGTVDAFISQVHRYQSPHATNG